MPLGSGGRPATRERLAAAWADAQAQAIGVSNYRIDQVEELVAGELTLDADEVARIDGLGR